MIGRAGANVMSSRVHLAGHNGSNSTISTNSKLPYSFTTALDDIEDEILSLQAEVAFCRKEVLIQKSECETVGDVAKSQCNDIERYLKKEVRILDEVIARQNERQNQEYVRLHQQCNDYLKIRQDLDHSRMEAVKHLI